MLNIDNIANLLHKECKHYGVSFPACLYCASLATSFVKKKDINSLSFGELNSVYIKKQASGPEASHTNVCNIEFSIASCIEVIASSAITASTLISEIWLLPFAVIVLVASLRKEMKRAISKDASFVLLAVAQCAASSVFVTRNCIKASVIRTMGVYGCVMSDKQFRCELQYLVDLGIMTKEGHGYKLMEKIEVC